MAKENLPERRNNMYTAEKAGKHVLRYLEQRGLHIGGCGCCGSPWLGFTTPEGKYDSIDNFPSTLSEEK